MKKNHIPLRMCCGCRSMKQKNELIKIVKTPDNNSKIKVDLSGKEPGRGAYICKDINCLNKSRKTRRFERSFSCKISDEIYNSIEQEIKLNE